MRHIFDVTRKLDILTAPPLGSINRARWPAEVASRNARTHAGVQRMRHDAEIA